MIRFLTAIRFQMVACAGFFLVSAGVALSDITTSAYSPTFGGIEINAEGLRETQVGIPFHRPAVFMADLVAVTPLEANQPEDLEGLRLQFNRAIGNAGQYEADPETGLSRFFIEVVTGGAMGTRLPIIGSGEDWVIIETETH